MREFVRGLAQGRARPLSTRGAGGAEESVTDPSKYVTLQDYLRVIRERRLIIIVSALLFAAAAFAYSSRQEPVYQAEASVEYQDPAGETELIIEQSGAPVQGPDQRSAITATQVTR